MVQLPRAICVDGNVVGKWYFAEEHAADAVRLKDLAAAGQLILLAPDILAAELVSVCLHKVLQGHATQSDARRTLDDFAAFSVPTLVEILSLRHRILELALQLPEEAWDAAYLAVAEHYGVELWTADQELARRARQHGLDWVRELGKDAIPW